MNRLTKYETNKKLVCFLVVKAYFNGIVCVILGSVDFGRVWFESSSWWASLGLESTSSEEESIFSMATPIFKNSRKTEVEINDI